MFSVWSPKTSIFFFRPLLRSARHHRTCGTVDEPPCPPQNPPKAPFDCASWERNTGDSPTPRCTHDEKKYYNACGERTTKEGSRRPNEPLFNRTECCMNACPELVPRLDDMFYKTSDKGLRRYPQTWVECPAPVKKTRISCVFDKVAYPPVEIRAKTSRPKTACNMMEQSCGDTKNPKCTRLVLPGCRSRRGTFHCLVERNPMPYCPTRRCPPYPSFSECNRKRPGPPKPIECKCLTRPNDCDVWAEIEKAVRTGRMKKILK